MNILEAIDVRKSRRVYLPEPVPADIGERLMELMVEFNREAGLSFRFIEDGSAAFEGLSRSYGMFSGVRTLMVLAGKPDDPHRREKVGYFGERLVLEATAYGLGSCWVAGTFDRKSPALGVPEEDELECVIPIGLVGGEPSRRERIIYRLTHGFAAKEAEKALRIEDYTETDADIPDNVRAGIAAAIKAPSAKNGKPVRFTWREGKLTATIPDTYPTQWIDLGIAKLHFVLAAGGSFPWGNGSAWESEGTTR